MSQPETKSVDFKAFLATRDYRGADMDIVRRITALAAFLTAFLATVLVPLSPPDGPLGRASWAIFVLIVGGLVLLGLRLRRLEDLRPNSALAIHFGGLASIALLVWLSDGRESPY